MDTNIKPKRALIAYCALAQRLNTPGVGVLQALTPFLAEACQQLSGQLFDAGKFSLAVAQRYGIQIPKLAALGLAEQLQRAGHLVVISDQGSSIVYRYADKEEPVCSLTETQVENVLASFYGFCSTDDLLKQLERDTLDEAFLSRLLNIDSMRILGRKDGSIAVKKTADTLTLTKPVQVAEPSNSQELRLDFMTSQFLLDLQNNDPSAFDIVSDVAFANMAAEALACFQEPLEYQQPLDNLTVYLDSPILLDMLGVNVEFADYGKELLQTIQESGAKASVLDHCVAEAEGAISAQLAYLRSGINNVAAKWTMSAKMDLLHALAGNVGARAYERLGINVERDPDLNLHRRAPTVVGDIEAEMNSRMQHWRNAEAKEHDRKSVWSMLSIRNTFEPCPRICDSKWIFLTRNTALVTIGNNAWNMWLKGTTKHSVTHVDKWAPISLSDKQFAGYVWARTGGGQSSIPRARLLANCSAAVRPRADIKAKAYNMILELNGKEEADDLAALLEDREGARALMMATKGDPEDVTEARLPYIMERIKLGAGEFAAAAVRQENEAVLREKELAHAAELEHIQKAAAEATRLKEIALQDTTKRLLQEQMDREGIESRNTTLTNDLVSQKKAEIIRQQSILNRGLRAGLSLYNFARWVIAIFFGLAAGFASYISTDKPWWSVGMSVVLGTGGFWFVPELFHKYLVTLSMWRVRNFVNDKDPQIRIPLELPDFRNRTWEVVDSMASENLADYAG